MRVLLVDDSGTMRAIIRRCLNKLSIHDITEAKHGVEALELFAGAEFDLVLTDWNMPQMDGLTLAREIRKQDGVLPILMITTEAERGRVLEAIQAGVSDYLVKPFTPDALHAKLSRWALPTL